MKVHTAQMNQWRRLKAQGIPYIDTTVKTGVKAFAPSWDMVLGVKDGSLSPADYTRRYHDMMELSFIAYPDEWQELLAHDEVTLLCYCRVGEFCHRHLLAGIVKDLCDKRNLPCVIVEEAP